LRYERHEPEHVARAEISRAYVLGLEQLGRRYILLEGSWEQRTAQVMAAVEELLEEDTRH